MSRANLIAMVSWMIAFGMVFWMLDVFLIKDPIHLFGTAGLGISALGMILFLVESFEGGERELPSE